MSLYAFFFDLDKISVHITLLMDATCFLQGVVLDIGVCINMQRGVILLI